jgi:hypothetical protein
MFECQSSEIESPVQIDIDSELPQIERMRLVVGVNNLTRLISSCLYASAQCTKYMNLTGRSDSCTVNDTS